MIKDLIRYAFFGLFEFVLFTSKNIFLIAVAVIMLVLYVRNELLKVGAI